MMFISVVLLVVIVSGSPVCKDDSGNTVDWWVAYKIPSEAGHPNHYIAQGLGYAYMDARSSTLTVSANSMNATTGTFISNTMNQIYNSPAVGNMMWNDEPPDRTSTSQAHAKGVMGFDSAGGFFLRHSIPLFPPVGGSVYSYPSSGLTYGQTLLCMTMDISNLNIVAGQFLVNYPHVYSARLPAGISAQNIVELSQGKYSSELSSIKSVTLRNGMVVTDFAKSKHWGKDLYEDLVAPTIQNDMKVETWGRPLQPSACQGFKYTVVNVEYVSLAPGITFHETKDHAKWGVSTTGQYTCIGDINRMTSQRNRGGGTTCLTNTAIHTQFTKIINQVQKC